MIADTVSSPTSKRWSWPRIALASGLLVIVVQLLLLVTSNAGVPHGVLFDPDCYMHLQRALRLMTLGGWRSGLDPRINAPDGFSIHWTVLFDGLLVGGAAALRLLGLGPREALYLWGCCISPVLLIAALGVFGWGVRSWIRGPVFLWLTVLLFTQPQLSGAFLAGRPDHHSLVLGLFLAQLAWLYATLDGRAGGRAALAAGLLAGVQLCTTVEALLTILLVSVVLGMVWAVYRKVVLGQLLLYLTGALVATSAWIALTSAAPFLPAYDRVSVVHVLVLAVGLAGAGSLHPAARYMPRLAALVLAGAVAGGIIAAVYPDFFLGPWPHLDLAIKAWHSGIVELQPILPTDLPHAAQFAAQFTAALLSLPLMLHLLRRGTGSEKLVMLTSLCGVCLFGGLALAQMRWSGEMQASILLPWTLTTQRLMRSPWRLWGLPMRSGLLAAALVLQMVPAALVPVRKVPGAGEACNWHAAALALASLGPADAIMMTQLWYGPEILWRSRLRVIGAPYEIPSALIDTNRFENGQSATARSVLSHRQVSYVLHCGPIRDAQVLGLSVLPFDVPGFRLYNVMR